MSTTDDGFTGGVPEEKGFGAKVRKNAVALVLCMASLPLLFLLASGAGSKPSFDGFFHVGAGSKLDSGDPPRDRLLGGLLSTAFENETSCRSRYEIASYWKASDHLPSPYLVQKLRAYEALHKRCGPNTELYRRSLKLLSEKGTGARSECNYVVWLPTDGLGNRIISLISTFLYALLTDRVLLIYTPTDLSGLFCEPFPESAWVLPEDFPVKYYCNFNGKSPQSYGNFVRSEGLAKNVSLPNFFYIHLSHDTDDFDRSFFCGETQLLLQRIPWLAVRSNQYFAPALFLLPEYGEELDRLFPEKDTVFNQLARYLLRPTDLVWGYITRYYESYLSDGGEMVGIQTRILATSYKHQLEQMVNCTMNAKLLPEVDVRKPISTAPRGAKPKVVLVTSLKIGYFERLRDMFYEHPTIDGEMVTVYQPSHEEEQRTNDQKHIAKALSEMYLLSFSDVLVTSAWSTFGYVANGLGGLKPWIMLTQRNYRPACRRAVSMEPCYHFPKNQTCRDYKYEDKGAVLPHVRHCEDADKGIKLFDQSS